MEKNFYFNLGSVLILVITGGMLADGAERPGMPRNARQESLLFVEATDQNGSEPSPELPVPTDHDTDNDEYVEVTGSEIEIVLKEHKLVPRNITVLPGTYTFVLRNEGRFIHNFHIVGPGVDTRTASKLRSGESTRIEVLLQEGTYRINCTLANHDKRGMTGTVLVKG